ncbi:MAG: hypothetical protein BMS9Abin37_0369 [Acidobacteriota bacterium]|nr:MAG: hypothetical protein BMS9Abin37_0369 [Acidobacteriota bacterium]
MRFALVAAHAPCVPVGFRDSRIEIVNRVAACARLPRLKMLEIMSGIVVTLETGFPALLDALPLDAGLMLGIPRVLDMSSAGPVARLAPMIGDLVEVRVW